MSFAIAVGYGFQANWTRYAEGLLAMEDVGLRQDVCGLGLAVNWWDTGGYTYSHLSVPIYWVVDIRDLVKIATSFNYSARKVVFVDDDLTDGTVQELEKTWRQDPRFRCIRRVGRRGLASAVIEGIQSTFTPLIAVMDADLQHDETLLAPMFELLRQNQADLVAACR